MRTALHGIPASPGTAVGTVSVIGQARSELAAEPVVDVDDAATRVAQRFEELAQRARHQGRQEEADILEAYVVLASDPTLTESVQAGLDRDDPLAGAQAAVTELADEFAAMEDPYFAQRADDVRAVGDHVVTAVFGSETAGDPHQLPEGAIVCAADLTPADTATLDLSRVAGIATERGGPTSHTAIVARSAGVPAVVGVVDLTAAITDGQLAVLDAQEGTLVLEPDDAEVAAARDEQHRQQQRADAHLRTRGQPAHFDGRRILVAANIGSSQELNAATEVQADGIGLLRSEFLFLERDDPPDAEEQRVHYEKVAHAFDDPVVVRTLDIGGDKPVAYLEMEDEQNPFLGVRGLRLWLRHETLRQPQLEALVAAGRRANLRVMFPMAATVDDVERCRQALREAAAAAGVAPPPAGVMIETPSAALLAPHLAPLVDFFSIGTNDLVQYVTAADRTAAALGSYQDPLHPPVLQLIARTVDAAAAAGIPVAVCGEAASEPLAVPVLLGLGVDELSVSPAAVDAVRWSVGRLDPAECRRRAREAVEMADAAAVRAHVGGLRP